MGKASSVTRRSRYGCNTCRIRRVKCDETLPECRRCLDTGRKCDGPAKDRLTIIQHRQQPKAANLCSFNAQPAVHLFAKADEARAFKFYVQCVAPILGGSLDTELWQLLLPQFCHSHLPVYQAILVVSTLYEHPLIDAYDERGIAYNPFQLKAIKWYKLSVTAALQQWHSKHEQQQLEMAMVTCYLFVTVEIQHANAAESCKLLAEGYRLMLRYETLLTELRLCRRPWLNALYSAFFHQGVLFGCFGYDLPPEYGTSVRMFGPPQLTAMKTLRCARSSLDYLLYEAIELLAIFAQDEQPASDGLSSGFERQQSLVQLLHNWECRVSALMDHSSTTLAEKASFHAFVCHHRAITGLVMSCGGSVHQPTTNRYDLAVEMLHHAREAVEYRRLAAGNCQLPFVIELGVVLPLFWLAWQSNSLDICQRVATVMERAPLQESIFVTSLQIQAVARLEEALKTATTSPSHKAGNDASLGSIVKDGQLYHGIDVGKDSSLLRKLLMIRTRPRSEISSHRRDAVSHLGSGVHGFHDVVYHSGMLS
jgi:hypothetical protein